jgi:hypothetical protein
MADIEPKEPTIAKVSEIELRAAEIKEKRALPTPPGKLVGFKDLQDWLALVPKDAEERLTIWIYRREPIINRQLVDPQQDNNIDIIFNGFNKLTEAYMRENHGGGNYKFTIKDADKPKTQMGGYFEAVLDIPMIDCPPKLDLREVDWNNPKNKGFKSWCRARKMIGEDDKPMAEIVKEDKTVTTGVDANMLKMMLDFTAKMSDKEQMALKQKIGGEDAVSKSMNELFLEKMKQEDPNKQSQTMIAMITAIKGMQPEIKSENTLALIMPMFMAMFQQMNEAAGRQMTLFVEMLKNNKPVERQEVDELEKLRNLLAIAKEIKGGGTAPEKTVTESIIEAGTQLLPPVLQIVANIQQANIAKGLGGTPPKSQGVSNGNGTDMMSQIQHGQIAPPTAQTAIPTPAPINEAAQIIAQFEPIIINKLSQEGWEFAAWIADGFGDMTAASIVKHGVEGLLAAAKSVPTFWQKIEASYGEPHLRKWLESLCRYKEIMAEMDKEDEVTEVEVIK